MKNDYTTQSNYRFNAIPNQIAICIFHRTKNFTIYMETQKSPNSQSNLEKEEWSWKNQPSWLQTILQNYSHQANMVLAQKQKHKSMEQDRKPTDKPTHLWVPFFWQRRQEYTIEKRQPLQQVVLGKLDSYTWKNETRTLSNTIYPWDSPGENTGVDCHFLLQRSSLTQGSNPGLFPCRQILLSEPPGKPF